MLFREELRNRMAATDIISAAATMVDRPDLMLQARQALAQLAAAKLPKHRHRGDLGGVASAEKADYFNLLAQLDPELAVKKLGEVPSSKLKRILEVAVRDGIALAKSKR